MDVIGETKKLGLEPDEYVVYSGGVLAVRKIRDTKDIDLLVTNVAFGKLMQQGGWVEVAGKHGNQGIAKGVFEVFTEIKVGSYEIDAESVIVAADIIDGVRFMNLDELIRLKMALGGEKDLRDIELIRAYQRNFC